MALAHVPWKSISVQVDHVFIAKWKRWSLFFEGKCGTCIGLVVVVNDEAGRVFLCFGR